MHQSASPPAHSGALRVIVAGGGVAGLEGALALQALAGALVDVTLVTATSDYLDRRLAWQRSRDGGSGTTYPIAEVVGPQVRVLREDVAAVDTIEQTVVTTAGRRLPFDALLMATGARPQVAHPYAITVDDTIVDDVLARLVADASDGRIHRVAFITSTRTVSLLPLYEMALMTSAAAKASALRLETMLVTPEHRALEAFGDVVSRGMKEILARANVSVRTGCRVDVPLRRQVVLRPGRPPVPVDRVIALPALIGAQVAGLPYSAEGFVPHDDLCRVQGTANVYAAGDLADHPVKHGGVAAQMAVVAARSIAASAGAAVRLAPLDVVLDAVLETGGLPRYLRARRAGETEAESVFSEVPINGAESKVTTAYLAARLEQLDGKAEGIERPGPKPL